VSFSLVLAVCALGAAIGRALIVVGWAIDGPLFAKVLRKVLTESDRARALKLCDAIGTPLGAACKRAIRVANELPSGTSAAQAKTAIEAAFGEAYAPIERLRTSRRWTALALVLAATAIGTSLARDGASTGAMAPIGAAAIALALLGWSEVRAQQTLAAGPLALEVLTELLGSSGSTDRATSDERDEHTSEPGDPSALFFGFSERPPERFFEALVALAARVGRAQPGDAIEVRLHVRDGAPRHVVSAWGSQGALAALRTALERAESDPELAPDATFGRETRPHAALLAELADLRPFRSSRAE
jgi:hypothetical protein